jgi:hypothetical protein
MVTVKKKMKKSIIFLWTNIEELYITHLAGSSLRAGPRETPPELCTVKGAVVAGLLSKLGATVGYPRLRAGWEPGANHVQHSFRPIAVRRRKQEC